MVLQNTTATNDLSADGYTWAQGGPLAVDQYGKLFAMAQQYRSNDPRHLPVVSNDNGATWSEPSRTSFFDANGEAFLIRGATAYDATHDLFHVVYVLTQSNGAVVYRAYSPTRDGSNNITGVTRVRNLQLEIGVAGMAFESPVAIYCSDNGMLLAGWTAINSASVTTKAEFRLTGRIISNSAADATLTNWVAPMNENAGAGATDSLGSTGLPKYSCLGKSANAQQPWVALFRKPASAATKAKDLVWFHVLGGPPGTVRFNRATWSAANSDWRGGFGAAIANDTGLTSLGSLLRAGSDTGYNSKYQLISKIAYDPTADKLWVGISTWKDNTAGDTWSIASINGSDAASSWVDVYTAGSANTDGARDIFVTGDVMYDSTAKRLVVSYTDLMRHDAYLSAYNDGALTAGPTRVYSDTPVDIPTLYDVRVNSKLALLFRNFNAAARNNPPTYTPPYAGYYISVSLTN